MESALADKCKELVALKTQPQNRQGHPIHPPPLLSHSSFDDDAKTPTQSTIETALVMTPNGTQSMQTPRLGSTKTSGSLVSLHLSPTQSFHSYFRTRPKFTLTTKASDTTMLLVEMKAHKFTITTFPSLTKCCVCTSIMRGAMRQGLSCSRCKYACHVTCLNTMHQSHKTCPLPDSISDQVQAEQFIREVWSILVPLLPTFSLFEVHSLPQLNSWSLESIASSLPASSVLSLNPRAEALHSKDGCTFQNQKGSERGGSVCGWLPPTRVSPSTSPKGSQRQPRQRLKRHHHQRRS